MQLSCSEDPDVKGTETIFPFGGSFVGEGCSEDPDVKGTETALTHRLCRKGIRCSEDPDVKGTETRDEFSFKTEFGVAARIPM